MSRFTDTFAALRRDGRKALIPFVTAGDPQPAITVPLMHEMVKAGANVIELGVAFSDPMADGPVIQKASERALAAGMGLLPTLDIVRDFRQQDSTTPVVLMGYLNPVEVLGYEKFAELASDAGVDGVLTVDMPPEEADRFAPILKAKGLSPIFLLAPTSNTQRIQRIVAVADGFVYYVSLKGVTGSNRLDVTAVNEKLAEIREHTELPVGVGFGISDAAAAAEVSRVADAVVVGSALVRKVEETPDDHAAIIAAITATLADMRQAMDAS